MALYEKEDKVTYGTDKEGEITYLFPKKSNEVQKYSITKSLKTKDTIVVDETDITGYVDKK
ncbi:5277_t:CDS:2 [Funneliformis geosporum]|uniref:19481_t:CDS:1 n=1 Tax=Funneliformis geosporum TaxID=1117311 RepID=A0A9W4T2A9_9GLOM|nr:19481_t:CDS:2 [Funneliformis geosporum]CAI2189743.1 5277_t:CDS:2 [Funneliformis geosporum]